MTLFGWCVMYANDISPVGPLRWVSNPEGVVLRDKILSELEGLEICRHDDGN